jgi:flagellar basal body rod protein FlgG
MPIEALQSAASALKVTQRRTSQTAHNLANVSTPGFAPGRVEQAETAGGGVRATATTPLPGGPLVSSGRPLDLALDGGGFFVLEDGAGGRLYTRAGNFQLNAQGDLVDPRGRAVAGGVNVPPEAASVHVTAQGQMQALAADGQVLAQGQLQTATFGNPAGLEPVGGNAFQATGASGPPLLGQPGAPGAGRVVSGALQASGTGLASSMVNLMIDQRTFEANTKSLQTADEMLGTILDVKG